MDAPIEVLIQHWPGVLFRQEPDLRFGFITGRIEEWTGHPVEAWRTDPELFLRCVHEDDMERVSGQLNVAADSTDEIQTRFRFRHSLTGRVTHIAEVRRSIHEGNGPNHSFEGFWQDESRLAHAERRLESAAWSEMLGRVTPAFAHDFNNVIAGVQGLSESFLSQMEPGHPFQEGLALVKKKTQQAGQLVQRLQQLHLPRGGERSYHDLNSLVKDAAELLNRALSKRLEIVTELPAEQTPIHADAARLQQVILALAFNAADAFSPTARDGRLTLRVSAHVETPRAHTSSSPLPAAPCVCLSVRDNGPGIKVRHLTRLFDPDFTTRPGHEGFGLGLSHARRFAASHLGALSVESTEGSGTTIRLWLPRASFKEADATSDFTSTRPRVVLVAGGPINALKETAETLRTAGMRVTIAGSDAEELLAVPDLYFDAVVVRPALKDIACTALVQFIRRHRLPLKIVLQPSGCADEDLDPKLLEKADLVIAESVSPERAAERIAKELFGR